MSQSVRPVNFSGHQQPLVLGRLCLPAVNGLLQCFASAPMLLLLHTCSCLAGAVGLIACISYDDCESPIPPKVNPYHGLCACILLVQLLVVSPLTRALQTATLAFGTQPDCPVVIEALWRERLYLSSDVGRHPEELQQEFPQ